MKKTVGLISAVAILASVGMASAQDRGAAGGAVGGAAAGAVGGAIVGGPVGAVVGGAAGAVAGSVAGSLTGPDRDYAVGYVRDNRRASVRYQGQLAVGAELPADVTLYEVQGRPSMRGYHYTYLNDRPVIVQNRRIIQIVE